MANLGKSKQKGGEMKSPETIFGEIEKVKAKYEQQLLRKKGVVSIGIGLEEKDGKETENLAIKIGVRKKLPPSLLKRKI